MALKAHALHFQSLPWDDDVLKKVTLTLPRPFAEEMQSVFVVFAGAFTPADKLAALETFKVDIGKVRAALVWLKQNNPLYSDVTISDANLQSLQDQVLAEQATQEADAAAAQREAPIGYAGRHLEVPADNESAIVQPVPPAQTDGQRLQSLLERRAGDRAVVARSGQLYREKEFSSRVSPLLFPYGVGDPASQNRDVELTFAHAVAVLQAHR